MRRFLFQMGMGWDGEDELSVLMGSLSKVNTLVQFTFRLLIVKNMIQDRKAYPRTGIYYGVTAVLPFGKGSFIAKYVKKSCAI